MQQICTAVLQNLADTFIIIDALDECIDTTEIKKVVEWLKNLVSGEGRSLHVLITSRDEGHITGYLSRIPQQQVIYVDKHTDADIKLYIDSRINTYGQLSQWSKDIQQTITKSLLDGADGM